METQVKNLFQKINLDFTTLKDTFNQAVNDMEMQINQTKDAVDSYLEDYTSQTTKMNELTTQLKELKDQVNILTKQETELKEQLSTLEKTKGTLQTQISEHERTQTELQAKKSELEATLVKLTNELSALNDDISGATKDLIATEEEYKRAVGETEDKINALVRQMENEENQYKVLNQLFKEGYVKDPTFDVLKGLGQPGIDDHKKLALSANTQEAEVISILKDLATHQIVSYDEATGKFTLLKELEL